MSDDSMELEDLGEHASLNLSAGDKRDMLISTLRNGGCHWWAEFVERAIPVRDDEMRITELRVEEGDDEADDRYDFSHPQDLIFELVLKGGEEDPSFWDAWDINEIGTVNSKPGDPQGALCYESAHGMGLEDLLYEHIPCPGVAGWHVAEGVTAHYSRGDGYSSDDDMTFYFPEESRPATPLEIGQYDMVAARAAMAAMQNEIENLRAAQAETQGHRP